MSYIVDWTTNNSIRADRKVESIYKDLLIQVKSIDTNSVQPSDNQMTTICQPSDNQTTAQVSIGKGSIGKGSIGKGSISKGSISKYSMNVTSEEVRDLTEDL